MSETEYKSVNIPEDAWHRFNAERKQLGLTWTEYIDGQSPDVLAEIQAALEGVSDEAIREAVREGVREGLEEVAWA